jgi:ribosomal protein L29
MATVSLELEHKDNVTYVAVCLDMAYGEPEWRIMSGMDEEALKKEMMDEGFHLEKSFVFKVNLPSIEDVKRDVAVIKTFELNPQKETVAKH